METPQEISDNAKCFQCVPDQASALLYLLAKLAGVTDPATIAANSVCYACVPDKLSALLYLADVIASNAAAAEGQVTCGDGAPTTAPTHACAIYYDTANNAEYIYVSGVWVLKV